MRRSAIGMSALAAMLAGCAVTPEPLSVGTLADYATDKRARVTAHQEPLSGPLTLHEAMARAIKYNLDKEVEVMQILLAERQLRVAHYSKLPGIVAGSGYADRNNYSGGSSVRLVGPTSVGAEVLDLIDILGARRPNVGHQVHLASAGLWIVLDSRQTIR